MPLKLVSYQPVQSGEVRLVAPTSSYDGMAVFVPLKSSNRVGMVPGKVVVAMGSTARVVCEDPPVDSWFRLDELRVPAQGSKP